MLVGGLFKGTVHWNQLVVYLAAEVIGAVIAGLLYVALNTRRVAAHSVAAPKSVPAEGVSA
jgi:glycerol uptake facilitator protein